MEGKGMSEDVLIAQKSPYKVELKKGEKYFWCACGKSAKQPFCDGSHKGGSFRPVIVTAEEDKTAWMCGCKHTAGQPFCDGSHSKL
jgi:CDGSH-type Zn-finger protein